MAHIKKIHFDSVSTNEGCTCDKCGQYIKNIWTVEFLTGDTFHYGIDCWRKIQETGGLNKQNKREFNRILKSIQRYTEAMNAFITGERNESNDIAYQNAQAEGNELDAFHGVPYEEYKRWHVEELFPYRIAEEQKELARFKRVDFEI